MCGVKPSFLYTGELYPGFLVPHLSIVIGIVLILRTHSDHQSTTSKEPIYK